MSRASILVLLVASINAPPAPGQPPAESAEPAQSLQSRDEPSTPAVPLYDNLGRHHWSVTASRKAQRYFDQGLRLLWGFNHAEAVRSFRFAEQLDSSCAMCAWGVALASGPNLNAPMERPAADTALMAIGRAARIAARVSLPEQALIAALAARYGAPGADDRAERDSAYAAAMTAAASRFRDDLEVQVLYTDALMNLSPWNYWNPDGTPRPATPLVLATLERTIAADSNHPGACHLFIHAVEAREPRRAVPCAERLAALMPGAGHIVHMPGHIYIRVGRYADAVEANRHAVHADQAYFEGPGPIRGGIYASGYYPHNHHFLAFAAAMMGASRLATEHAFLAADAVDPDVARANPWIQAITPIGYWTLVTFGKWQQILAEPLPPAEARYTVGMAYYARGTAFAARHRWAEARAALDTVSAIAATAPAGDNRTALAIAEYVLVGEIAMRRGEFAAAIRSFAAAARLEDGLAYTEPPTWYYPVRHSLGKALLAAGRPVAAERAYREDLERFPDNGWSLYGLREALQQQGKRAEADLVGKRFERAWAGADVDLAASRF